MLIAEELDADWSTVSARWPAGEQYKDRPSASRLRAARAASPTLSQYREIGAKARAMLIAAAAAMEGAVPIRCAARAR
jgi:isoquinoline 1-oxidoreductase beta subunit